MFSFKFLIAYLIGGLTLFPITILLLAACLFIYNRIISPIYSILFTTDNSIRRLRQGSFNSSNLTESPLLKSESQNDESGTISGNHLYKVGWLKVSRDEEQSTPDASIGDIVKSYISGKASKRESENIYFAVLKYSTLYLYDSEKQLDCKGVIILNNHTITTHPPGLQDFELFSKPHLIKLSSSNNINGSNSDKRAYFINCNRCIDKEDWFFAFIRASKLPSANQSQAQQHDKTHFDQTAMNHLITMVHSDEHHFQTQWLNAILGRMFFGIYRTQDVKDALYKKVMSKLDKINAKRPPFLGEITVRSVDPGHSLPRFTQPKLLGLSPTGELTAEAHMQYDGGFRIEISTVLKWKYSDRLRPLTIDLVLGITLKEIQGKILFKIKEPPTNRFWYGFYECPKMEWKVEPVVWEKQIGYSVVVKAIETKIQEFIMETMVLPNFDDITFFPTNGVGGIFEVPPDETTESNIETPTVATETPVTTTPTTPVTSNTSAPAAKATPIPIAAAKLNKKSKEEHKERHRNDEALLTTAKSLPELFSAVPDRQQQTSKLRTQISDNDSNKSEPMYTSTIYHTNASTLSTSPISTHSIISKSINISCSPRLVPADDTVPGQIAISKQNTNNDASFVGSFLSSSPDSLSSSPSSSTVDDSLRTLTHVLTDETNLIVSPSTSSTLACDSTSSNVQITYSQDYTTNTDTVHSNDQLQIQTNNVRLRKSSSLALLRPKTGASTAINVSPAMAHKQCQDSKKDVDSVSVAVVSA